MEISINQIKQDLIRQPDCGKNDFGHAIIIGGDYKMGGAVIMAAEAAYRAGAGKVSLLTREENFTPLLARLPNAMTVAKNSSIKESLKNKNLIVIGCGLGQSAWAEELLAAALNSALPKIIDADALNMLCHYQNKPDLSNSIITPHVGEASKLLGISINEVRENRQLAIEKLYQKFGAIAVLKGMGTLVLGHSKNIYQCPNGNAGMATAGMGDVLSGIIGGLVAQGLGLEKAAIYGVKIHAVAGDLVAKKQGKIGMIPTDLFQFIPQIIN